MCFQSWQFNVALTAYYAFGLDSLSLCCFIVLYCLCAILFFSFIFRLPERRINQFHGHNITIVIGCWFSWCERIFCPTKFFVSSNTCMAIERGRNSNNSNKNTWIKKTHLKWRKQTESILFSMIVAVFIVFELHMYWLSFKVGGWMNTKSDLFILYACVCAFLSIIRYTQGLNQRLMMFNVSYEVLRCFTLLNLVVQL